MVFSRLPPCSEKFHLFLFARKENKAGAYSIKDVAHHAKSVAYNSNNKIVLKFIRSQYYSWHLPEPF